MLGRWGANGSRVIASESYWKQPLKWNKEAAATGEQWRVFAMSLGDVFEDRPELIAPRIKLFRLIADTPALTWLVLTKRPQNIAQLLPANWGDGWPNVWLGTTIEDNRVVKRADFLRAIPAAVRFVSYEPAIGPLDELDLTGLHWLIVGGESGSGFRPMDFQWARDLRARCHGAGVAYFFKQSPGIRTGMGELLDGETIREYPRTTVIGG